MDACPACAAPLDGDGICTACGALSRGYFRGLDLGAPQVAQAVARGLDFYQLLGVAPTLELRAVALRYRQLRALFPDDPARLSADPARRLALLETAGRVLTDPQLRRLYDEMRARPGAAPTAEVLRCDACAAPLAPEAARCPFCGTPRPASPQAPAAPPEQMPPPAEPVDYYAMLGLTAEHLAAIANRNEDRRSERGLAASLLMGRRDADDDNYALRPAGPPSPDAIDEAALKHERQALLAQGLSAEERAARLEEIQIARRILRHERRRGTYDMLLLNFSQGLINGGRLAALRQLQDEVRAELAEERGDALSPEQGAALLKHGLGYLQARLPREAVAPLGKAVAALPRSAEAHHAYVQALLGSADPLDLGGHLLREALKSIDAAEALGAPVAGGPALAALCRGLLLRDSGDLAGALGALGQATRLDGRLASAWRAMAAIALGRAALAEAQDYCRRALAVDPRDERALLMLAGACLRGGQRAQAREAAAQVAALRADGSTADQVLRELGG